MSEATILPAPALNVMPPFLNKWQREYQAFKRLLPELLKTHRGKYVAIHNEQVVEAGDDPISLIKQVHARYGYVPIHVDRVVDQPPAPIRVPHYRLYRPQAPS